MNTRALITGGTRGIGAAISAELAANGIKVDAISRSNGYDLSTYPGLEAARHLPVPDILVNCVGGGGRFGTEEEVFSKNVGCMIALTEWALPHMVNAGWGRIVTISSIHGRERGASRAIFSAAKAAQIAYMKVMSANPAYVRCGITFNTVCPGNVYVEGKPRVDEDALPLGRMGTPVEIAKLVGFLCSNDASYINGSCIVADGGESYAM